MQSGVIGFSNSRTFLVRTFLSRTFLMAPYFIVAVTPTINIQVLSWLETDLIELLGKWAQLRTTRS